MKALLMWHPAANDQNRRISFATTPVTHERLPVFPSLVGRVHRVFAWSVREEVPAPFTIELVHLELTYSNSKGKPFYVAYPCGKAPVAAPGIHETLRLKKGPRNEDLLGTHFLAPNCYVRVFRGSLLGNIRNQHPNGNDISEWSALDNIASDAEVECWISYVTAHDNRTVGFAYPSIARNELVQKIAKQPQVQLARAVPLVPSAVIPVSPFRFWASDYEPRSNVRLEEGLGIYQLTVEKSDKESRRNIRVAHIPSGQTFTGKTNSTRVQRLAFDTTYHIESLHQNVETIGESMNSYWRIIDPSEPAS